MKLITEATGLLFILFIFQSCSSGHSEEAERKAASAPAASGKMFHSQKEASYGDSLHIRVLSWGGEETGSYLVLVADSLNKHYIGNSFFRQGVLSNIWVDDLDRDGMPEIGVVLQESENLRYGRLSVHELSPDFTLQSVNFPPLSETLGADYGGRDSVYKRDDKVIVREFHLLDRLDTLSQSSRRRRIFYLYENNQLTLSGSEETY